MNINSTFSKTNHAKSIIAELKSTNGLPFSEVLSSASITKSIGSLDYRDRIFSPDITLFGFLSQVLDADKSLQAAVTRVIAFFLSQGVAKTLSANTAAYSKARTRLPEKLLSDLVKESGAQLEEKIPIEWLWREKHVKLMDGVLFSMPDTEANQAIYPQTDSQAPGVGFPIARAVAVISCATGGLLNLAIGPYAGKKTGEHALLRQLMDTFEAGDVALGDAYYSSYFLMAVFIKKGVDVVFPIHASRHHDFRKGEKLGKKDHVVEWIKPQKPEWMTQEEYDSFEDTITVREVSVEFKRKGFQTKSRVMVTTFLDAKLTTKEEISTLYGYRWGIELDFRSIKETMGMDVLRGRTPEMVRKEIWAHLLAYNLIRKIMSQAAYKYNKNPREISFKLALQTTESFRMANIFSETNDEIYMEFLKIIAYKTVGNRPNRMEPRRIKRRPKAFPRLQKARRFYPRVLRNAA